MKKRYISPELEVVEFSVVDILTISTEITDDEGDIEES